MDIMLRNWKIPGLRVVNDFYAVFPWEERSDEMSSIGLDWTSTDREHVLKPLINSQYDYIICRSEAIYVIMDYCIAYCNLSFQKCSE